MSNNLLPLITQRLLNRPLYMHPQLADMAYSVLEGRVDANAFNVNTTTPDASRFIGSAERENGERPRRYTRAAGHTALITIDGALVNRGAWVGADFCTGMVSYEGIGGQLDEVVADAKRGLIQHLVLDINSYGGEATGMAALAAKINAARKHLHIVAVVNDVAASAGYGIACSADVVAISKTSMVGSIGVLMLHLDRSGELNAKGIRPTVIHAGAKKADGNPFGPLPDNVRSDMTKDVMAFYEQFLATVEAGRGKKRLSAQKARETEADVFIGQEAIDAGLADRFGTVEEIIAELTRPASMAGKSKTKGATKMDLNETEGMVSKADHETAVAAAKADGITAGATAERTRLLAILNSDEAKAHPKAALALANGDEGITAKTAIATLATLGDAPAPAAAAEPAAAPEAAIPPVSERAKEPEFSAPETAPDANAAASAAKAGWGKAVSNVNSGR